MRSNGVASLKILSKREQSHACMFYAEREGLRPERSKSKQNYNKSTEDTELAEDRERASLTERMEQLVENHACMSFRAGAIPV